jgi:S-adenosylmethionine hydrolase
MPLLTLTSDIGHQDYLVSAVKAQLLQVNPEFNIVDISHSILPFNYPRRHTCAGAPCETFLPLPIT